MKKLKLWILALIVIGSTASGVNAQLRTYGSVVEVLDGKTVVVAVPAGHVKVELQYIDVPEVGQPLHESMTDHLRKLVAGKAVELQTRGFSREKITGKLVLDGIDISQQLLRNGAAWHLKIDKSGQNRGEFDAYSESETLARLEKRGVWSVAGLEPAWEFREKKKAAAVQPKVTTVASEIIEPNAATKPKGYWADENPRLKNPTGMTHGFNAATQSGWLGTPLLGVNNDGGTPLPPGEQMIVVLTYYYTEHPQKGRSGYFLVRVRSIADEWRFLKSNTLALEIDGKKSVIGKPNREARNDEFKRIETLTYRVEVSTISKIAHGSDVVVKVGDRRLRPRPFLQMVLYNMLEVAKG